MSNSCEVIHSAQFQQHTNTLINGLALSLQNASTGTEKAQEVLSEVKRIVEQQDQRGLQRKLHNDTWFLSYIFNHSILDGESPAFPQELKLPLAAMMMETFGTPNKEYKSVLDAPLLAETLLDSRHYSISDGITFALRANHPLAPYKAFQLSSQMEEYRGYNFAGKSAASPFYPNKLHLVHAVKDALVAPQDLQNHECYTMAKFLLQSESKHDAHLAVSTGDSHINGQVLFIDGSDGQEMRAGDFLSNIKDRDEQFWREVFNCFQNKDQVIVLDGEQTMTRANVAAKLPVGVKCNGMEDELLDKAVQALHNKELSPAKRAEIAMDYFQKAMSTLDGIDKSLEPTHRPQLWAVAMRTLTNGRSFWSARGEIDFLQAFLVFLHGAERDPFYFDSPDYEVNGKTYSARQDAEAVRCVALTKLTNWTDMVDIEIRCLGDSFLFETVSSFKYLIRYPEGRSRIWNKEHVNHWIFYGSVIDNFFPHVPIQVWKRIYHKDGSKDASRVLLSRLQYFELVSKLDPKNEIVQTAMQVLQANPDFCCLTEFNATLAAIVAAETKVSNSRDKTSASGQGIEAKLGAKDAVTLQSHLEEIKSTTKAAPIKSRLVNLGPGVSHAHLDPKIDHFSHKTLRFEDLPPITPSDLDKYSSLKTIEHHVVEAYLNDPRNTTSIALEEGCGCAIL